MLAFYRDTLGMKVGYQHSGFANLRVAGGAEISLHAGRKNGPTQERYWITEFIVDDIESVSKALTSRGVAVSPIRKEPFGQIAEFKDPEGNVIGLEQPPQR